MALQGSLLALVMLSCIAATSHAVTFSSLNHTLIVTATSASANEVLKGGDDNITVSWVLNTTFPTGTDSTYHTVKVELCYAPISQKDRGWRKTEDHLSKDKTCQHKIVSRPYSNSNNTFTWTIQKDVPTATYFVRAYALNSAHHEVAYGQAANLFVVQAVSGRHATLDITSICFSVFSIVSLFGFFYMEKRNARMSQQK